MVPEICLFKFSLGLGFSSEAFGSVGLGFGTWASCRVGRHTQMNNPKLPKLAKRCIHCLESSRISVGGVGVGLGELDQHVLGFMDSAANSKVLDAPLSSKP